MIPRSRAAALMVAALVAVALTGCGSASTDDGGAGTGFVSGDGSIVVLDPAERQPAPAIEGDLLGGGRWSLAEQRGLVVVLNVWASWCAPCRAEAPVLEETWREFADQGVAFVGLDTRDSTAAALAFVETYDITYPNVIDADGRLQLAFRDTLPPQAIPSTVVVDREGRVAARVLGRVSGPSLAGIIESLLAEPAPPGEPAP